MGTNLSNTNRDKEVIRYSNTGKDSKKEGEASKHSRGERKQQKKRDLLGSFRPIQKRRRRVPWRGHKETHIKIANFIGERLDTIFGGFKSGVDPDLTGRERDKRRSRGGRNCRREGKKTFFSRGSPKSAAERNRPPEKRKGTSR